MEREYSLLSEALKVFHNLCSTAQSFQYDYSNQKYNLLQLFIK